MNKTQEISHIALHPASAYNTITQLRTDNEELQRIINGCESCKAVQEIHKENEQALKPKEAKDAKKS